MSLLRTATASLRVGAASASASATGRRSLMTTSVSFPHHPNPPSSHLTLTPHSPRYLQIRNTDDPNILDKDTHSGASVKADKHSKDPKTLQKETTESANASAGSTTGRSEDAPTHSEDAVHGEKHGKSPEQLQKETAAKHN